MPRYGVFCYLTCLVFSELPGSVVCHLTLFGEILSHYCFKYCFCFILFLFLLALPLHICYVFCSCPRVLGYFVLSISFFFSLNFCFRRFYQHFFKLTDSFFSHRCQRLKLSLMSLFCLSCCLWVSLETS